MADKQFNVESKAGTIEIPTSDTVSTGTETPININGLIKHVILTSDNMEGSDSTKLELVTKDDVSYLDTGTIAESTTTTFGTEVFVRDDDKIVVTAEGTQSAARDISYVIRYST